MNVGLNKEQITAVLAGLLAALLGWRLSSWTAPREGRPNKAGVTFEAPRVPVPLAVAVADGDGRNPLEPPRDTFPLEAMTLELPPRPAVALLAPPTVPGVHVSGWHRFYAVESLSPGAADEEEAGRTDPGDVWDEDLPDGEASDEELFDGLDVDVQEDVWARSYDWVEFRPGDRRWGFIRNPKRFDLRRNPAERLVFERWDPDVGRFLQKMAIDQASVSDWGFAKTVSNHIELRRRELKETSGFLDELEAWGYECLAAAPDQPADESPRAFDEAERVFGRMTDLEPTNPRGWIGLGKAMEAAFRLEDAYELYRAQTLAGQGDPKPFHTALGQLQARLGMGRAAVDSLRRGAVANAAGAAALGRFLLDQGQPGAAAEALAPHKRVRTGAPVRLLYAEALLAQGRLVEAASEADGAATAVGDAAAWATLAAVRYAQGNLADAVEICADHLGEEPSADVSLLLTRGLCLARMGVDGAEDDLLAAAAMDPLQTALPLAGTAFLHAVAGRVEEAWTAAQQAWEADPTDPYVLYLHGRLARLRADTDTAARDLDAALGRSLDFQGALVERGLTALDTGAFEDADRYLVRASTLTDDPAPALSLAGLARLSANRLSSARDAFQSAVAADRESWTARNGLATILYADDELAEAQRGLAAVVDQLANQDDSPHAAWASETLEAVSDHATKRVWRDRFDRTVLLKQWQADARLGPVWRMAGGQVVLAGRHREKGDTRLYHEIDASKFLAVEADVTVPAGAQGRAGLFIAIERKSRDATVPSFLVGLLRDPREGEVLLVVRKGVNDPEEMERVSATWPLGTPVRISFTKHVPQSGLPRIEVLLDGVPVGSPITARALKSPAGSIRAGVMARADTQREVGASLDNFDLTFRTTEDG